MVKYKAGLNTHLYSLLSKCNQSDYLLHQLLHLVNLPEFTHQQQLSLLLLLLLPLHHASHPTQLHAQLLFFLHLFLQSPLQLLYEQLQLHLLLLAHIVDLFEVSVSMHLELLHIGLEF